MEARVLALSCPVIMRLNKGFCHRKDKMTSLTDFGRDLTMQLLTLVRYIVDLVVPGRMSTFFLRDFSIQLVW